MSAAHPDRIWWTALELAEARLPDMPASTRNVTAMAERLGWRQNPQRARRRAGRGGGWEYHWHLLPDRARMHLLKTARTPDAAPRARPGSEDAAEMHRVFDELTERAKEKARQRLRILRMVEAMEVRGLTKNLSVVQTAQAEGVSPRSIWNWFDMVSGIDARDWLPYLAPRHGSAARTVRRAEIDPAFMTSLKADYLRLERPSFASSYRRVETIAEAEGTAVPPLHTARRRLNTEVPRVTRVLLREGNAGLARCYPPQIRDRTGMVAMEGVNADCHKFDVFVRWPGHDKPARAQIVAFQDIFSGKILSWRIDHTPNKVMVMAAFGDLVERWGIPAHCLFDNGREFAQKWMTGGAGTRFRFKLRDDDPAGVLELLGVKIHWAKPAHGQAKPIERAFRDFADDIAKDPRFAGAYVGNRPDAKPENYGDRAIEIERFIEVVADGIAEHNARQGRLSPTVLGRSFDEAFAESYARVPVRKPTPEQRRIWLMGQEVRKLHRDHARLTLFGNMYHSDWMAEHAGEKIIARFDPEDLHAGMYVYTLDGRFLGTAACQEKVGFFDATEAHAQARREGAIRRTQKALARALNPGSAKDVGDALDAARRDPAPDPELKVVRARFDMPARTDGAKVEADPLPTPSRRAEDDSYHAKIVQSFPERREKAKARQREESVRERFDRALELMARSERGARLGEAEVRWLRSYAETAEYRQERRMRERLGGRKSPG